MKNFLKKIVIRSTFKKAVKIEKSKELSDYVLAKGYRSLKINIKRAIKDFFLITLGIFLAAFGFKGFLLTNDFIDGGATGISLLISALTDVPLHYLIILVNAPFIFLAYSIMGRKFAIKTVLAIAGLAICLATVTFPNVTNDNLLVSVFGGFFLGAGIGFAVRGGAVIDGTEVLAIYVSRKIGATVGDVIIVINIMIFSAAAYLLGVEIALYSMITYIAASKTLDFIIEGIEEYIGVTIVSTHSEEIRSMIINGIGRGVTIYKGERGFGKTGESQEMDIIYSVITRLDINKLNTEVQKIDPNAFVVMHSVKDIKGGMIKRRPLH